jgi:hypothetical protein
MEVPISKGLSMPKPNATSTDDEIQRLIDGLEKDVATIAKNLIEEGRSEAAGKLLYSTHWFRDRIRSTLLRPPSPGPAAERASTC